MVVNTVDTSSFFNDFNAIASANPISSDPNIPKFIENMDQIIRDFEAVSAGMFDRPAEYYNTPQIIPSDKINQVIPSVAPPIPRAPVSPAAPTSGPGTASVPKGLKVVSPSGLNQGLDVDVLGKTSKPSAVFIASKVESPVEGLSVIPEGYGEMVREDVATILSNSILQGNTAGVLKTLSEGDIEALTEPLRRATETTPEMRLTIKSVTSEAVKPPETAEEIIQATRRDLDKYNPGGKDNDDNRLISIYYPNLGGAITQGLINPHELADNIRFYIAAEQGGDLLQTDAKFFSGSSGGMNTYQKAFAELTPAQQQERLALVYKQAIASGCGNYVAITEVASLISHDPNPRNRSDLDVWVANGGLDQLVNSDSSFTTQGDVKEYLSSSEGQMTIGAGFAVVGAIGGVLTGGVAPAVAGVGMGIFSITELPNLFQMKTFVDKDKLQAQGIYAPDREYNYEQTSKSTSDLVNRLAFDGDKLDDSTRKQLLAESIKSYNNLGQELIDNRIFLQAQGSYEQKLRQYKDIGATLDSISGRIDGSTGAVLISDVTPGTFTIIPPKGGYVEVSDMKIVKGEPAVITTNKNREISYNIFDSSGRIIDSKTQKLWPGYTGTDDATLSKSFPQIQEEQKTAQAELETPKFVRTVTIPAGATGLYDGVLLKGGLSYDLTEVKGHVGNLQITQPGKDPYTQQIYFTGASWDDLRPVLSDAFAPVVSPNGGVVNLNLKSTQKLTIDGEEIPTKYNQLGRVLADGTHSFVVTEEGKEPVVATVWVSGGKAQDFSIQGKDVFKASSGGGGGGGGGSGGSYGGSSSKPKAQTMIMFGSTLEGARIWLDDVEISPELKKAYATTPGYHALKATKDGFKDYVNTVYAMDSQTLNVDVAFVAGSGSGSGSSGTTLIFGNTLKDARVWLDDIEVAPEIGKAYEVLPGYHSIRATKDGFNEFSKLVYVAADASISVDSDWQSSTPGSSGSDQALITFGAAVQDAQVYVDEVLTSVVPGETYELATGYHGIRITKTNKYDWIKTVFLSSGDTLTVSPVFEDLPVSSYVPPVVESITTKRVFINSDPSGAKILINGGFTGEWTPAYVDLNRGLYQLTTQKAGYDDVDRWIYVGDVVAFDETALALADISGMVNQ